MARAVTASLLAYPLVGARFRVELAGRGAAVIIRLSDGVVVGALELGSPEPGVLFVDSICIDAPHRSYGAGSEAARLVIDAAEGAGYRLLRAWAPATLGLAVYFWFRMGLHPLHGEGPDGGIWLERRLG